MPRMRCGAIITGRVEVPGVSSGYDQQARSDGMAQTDDPEQHPIPMGVNKRVAYLWCSY